ncbi:hypothetical protein F5888DRAFT_1703821 [Russula emetica]|nr:hypothetical protein F5888DRAFT_1703821 [Russula emetica]
MSDHSKRTRSQLILSEEFGEIHLGVSPLRAARQERRKNIQTDPLDGSSEATPPPNVEVGGDESDDELLLSPHKTRPPKRQPLSQQPESPSRTDHERQCKRLKQDHNDEQSHVGVAETRRPNGPFDFSAVNPELLPSTSHEQHGASTKQRAHTFPLDSPTIRPRDLGQLMPSPGKASIVLLQDVLRFSSLPRSLGPSTDAMAIDNDVNAKLSEESKRDKSPERSQTPPPSTELDSSSSLETQMTEEKCTTTPNSQHPSVTSGLEVMTFSLTQLPAMAPRISPEEPDCNITPKPVKPPPASLDVNPIPLALGDPSSLPDDAPSPLSTLSSMSELSPPPDEPEVHTPKVEHPSGIPRAIQPSSAPLRDTTENSGTELFQVARSTTTTSRGRGGGFASSAGSDRLTRSSSIKKQEMGSLDEDVNSRPQGVTPESSVPSSVPTKRPSDSPALAPDFSKKKSSTVAVSHRKAFSFAMPTSSSRNKTAEKAPASSPLKPLLFTKQQPPKLPSSIKPVSSLGLGELPYPSKHTGLSNLSLALEKLKNPPPSRPATTLGFNSDTRFVSNTLDAKSAPKAKDDSTIRLGHGLPSSAKAITTPLRRAFTAEPGASSESNARASGSGPATLIAPRSAHPTDSGPTVKKINLHSGVVVGKSSSSKPRGFVYGGVGKKRPFEKVSKKSSLPVVEGSPVKACGSAQAMDLDRPPLPSAAEVLAATLSSRKEDNGQEETPAVPATVEPMNLQDAIAEHVSVAGFDNSSAEDGKAEPTDIWKHASRRASLASQFLQQTLAVLPSTPPPPKASDSKSKAAERSQFSSQRTRSGLRSGSGSDIGSSRSTPKTLSNGHMVGTHVSKSGSTTATSSSLKVLKSCTIFVDTDAGGLFVDMLKGLGAKIIGRAGQSCTHIVYKNGLMSTLTKYRLMREPKPFVVGISWVVECAEKCRRVGEENFLVDLEGVNVAGNNKRRRSMLPKHISWSTQSRAMAPPSLPGSSLTGMLASDQSMDGSSVGGDRSMNSSDGPAEDEDDLPPLERARQRRNIFFKS